MSRRELILTAFQKVNIVGELSKAVKAEIESEGPRKISQHEREARRLKQQKPIWDAADDAILYLRDNFGGDEQIIRDRGREFYALDIETNEWIKAHRDMPFDTQIEALILDGRDATVAVWMMKIMLAVYRAPLNPAKMKHFDDFAALYRDIIL